MTGWAAFGLHGLGWPELAQLFGHFLMLSMLAIGGALATAPEMHRYLVTEQGWLSDAQFTSAVAIAQAAPGPNLLFVPLMGWSVAGAAGLVATLAGILLPSSLLTMWVSRYRRARADALPLRAFTAGMVPITLGLLLSTSWVLTAPVRSHWITPLLVLVAAGVLVRTKLSPLWLIGGGALAGAAFL